MERRLINAKQFAEAAGVAPQTVRNMTENGELTAYPMPGGGYGYDINDVHISIDKQLRKVENGSPIVNGSLYINVKGDGISEFFNESIELNGYKIKSILELLTQIRMDNINSQTEQTSSIIDKLTELNNNSTDANAKQQYNTLVKEIMNQPMYKMVRQEVLKAFIKKYKRSADSYVNSLKRKYPALKELPAIHLDDLVYFGVSKHGVEVEDFRKLFDCLSDEEWKEIQIRMNETLFKFANITLGIKGIKREDMTPEFFECAGQYYKMLSQTMVCNFKNDYVKQISLSVQAKLNNINVNISDKLKNGFYGVITLEQGFPLDVQELLFNEILKGYYNKIYFNVSENKAKELVPAIYLGVKYLTRGTQTAYMVEYKE